jgi:hypothetical protein
MMKEIIRSFFILLGFVALSGCNNDARYEYFNRYAKCYDNLRLYGDCPGGRFVDMGE